MRTIGFILLLNLIVFSTALERGEVSIFSNLGKNIEIKKGDLIPEDTIIISNSNSIISSTIANLFIKKNSTIKIKSTNNSLIIDIFTGEIVVNSSGSASVLFKDGLIEVYGTTKISKIDSSNTTLSVLNGFSRVTDKSGKKGEMFSRGYSINITENSVKNSGRYFFKNDISNFCNLLNCSEKPLFHCSNCSLVKGDNIAPQMIPPTSYLIVNQFNFLTDKSPFGKERLQETILKDSAVQSEFIIFTPRNYGYNIARELEFDKKQYLVLDGVIKEDMNNKTRFNCNLTAYSSNSPKQVISKTISFQSSSIGSGEVVSKELQLRISQFIMENSLGD